MTPAPRWGGTVFTITTANAGYASIRLTDGARCVVQSPSSGWTPWRPCPRPRSTASTSRPPEPP